MAIEDRFGEPADENPALQRGLKQLRAHNRNVASEETAQEVLDIEIPTRDDRELQTSQENEAWLQVAEKAVTCLQQLAEIQAEDSESDQDSLQLDTNPDTKDDDLAQIEVAERRAAQHRPRNSPIDARRIRKPDEITDGQPNIARHKRRCTVCKHPEREAIEEAFLQWRRPGDLRLEFDLPNRTSIYRHAHTFGLFEKRARNLRHALGAIIEEAERVEPTADSILRAIRAYGCIDNQGRWIEPPKHIIISRQTLSSPKLAGGEEIEVKALETGES